VHTIKLGAKGNFLPYFFYKVNYKVMEKEPPLWICSKAHSEGRWND